MADEFEIMPGNWIIDYGEIRNHREGLDFAVTDDNGDRHVIKNDDALLHAYFYYFEIWENWHYLQILPHGKGWIHELPWVIDFIKLFEKVYSDIEVYRIEKRRGK